VYSKRLLSHQRAPPLISGRHAIDEFPRMSACPACRTVSARHVGEHPAKRTGLVAHRVRGADTSRPPAARMCASLSAAARRSGGRVQPLGTERDSCPNADQKTSPPRLAEAGADMIIGAHAHVLQGDGWLGRPYVGYGLGNLVWYVGSADTRAYCGCGCGGRSVISADLVPAVVSGTGSRNRSPAPPRQPSRTGSPTCAAATGLAPAPPPPTYHLCCDGLKYQELLAADPAWVAVDMASNSSRSGMAASRSCP